MKGWEGERVGEICSLTFDSIFNLYIASTGWQVEAENKSTTFNWKATVWPILHLYPPSFVAVNLNVMSLKFTFWLPKLTRVSRLTKISEVRRAEESPFDHLVKSYMKMVRQNDLLLLLYPNVFLSPLSSFDQINQILFSLCETQQLLIKYHLLRGADFQCNSYTGEADLYTFNFNYIALDDPNVLLRIYSLSLRRR